MIDLHTHSTYSDGTLTPSDLVALAAETGLSAVALCDHNTVAGLPDFLSAAQAYALEAVPGVEFSTEYQGGELHILGLFIPPEHYKTVTDLLETMLKRKEQSNLALIQALRSAGICLDYHKIIDSTPGQIVNRAVIAAEMVRLGYCVSVPEAFRLWLSPELGFFHPPKRPDALETIRLIGSIGAVSVLAHPLLNLEETSLRSFLTEAKDAGLDAMETRYSTFSAAQSAALDSLITQFDLLPSGGSDFHGSNKPDIRLGCGRGALRVPRSYLDNLRNRAAKYR